MLKNLFLVAFRNLKRQRLYSFINIFGLAVGLICTILILLWVEDETSYDSFLPKYKKLQQVWVSAQFDGKINSWRSVPLPTYEAMKNAHNNIKESCVTGWGGDRLVSVGDKRIIRKGYFVSEEFLEMFRFPLKYGEAGEVLDEPKSIVITESLAEILFKDENPVGQMITFQDKDPLKVTGILKDIPGNSSFQFDYLVTWKYRESINEWVVKNKTNWGNYSFQVFIELFDEKKQRETEAAVETMLTENGEDDIPRSLFLHPMPRWRLHSNFVNGEVKGGMSDYVKFFSIIALLILLVACINFMNLSTARSEKRAREVGIRKSLGSTKKQLIYQFISESILISLIAYFIALGVTLAVLPWYNYLVDKKLSIDFSSGQFWIFSLAVVLITGIIAGSYPAFYLSGFSPVKTLKGTFKSGKNSSLPRKVLVVIQFGFAIVMMISMVIITQQIRLVQNRDLGYRQENLISVSITDDLTENYEVLKQELLSSGAVEAVTQSNSRITTINSNNFVGWPGKPESLKVIFTTIATEYDYTRTMGIDMLMGRDFSKEFPSDSDAIIINRAALDVMNLEEPIIGTKLDLWGEKRNLIGVVDNALMGSPYEEIRPMFMIMDPEWVGSITLRLKETNDLQGTLATVENIFQKHNPAYPFEYQFADVEFQRKFTTIALTRKLATIFASLALIITGLGLFGLAAFTAQQRIKEIGIRKVLGASIANLVGLLSKDFSRLVIISFIIAGPVAWILMDNYLNRYAIRIEINWWIFPLVGVIALLFALLVVSNQALRAASSNPVDSLRNE